ncbi:peptide deformylase [Spirulina sp. CS-785/01]|uniref:peptide deformylase n=1 Tax=Spirulina sp. CS-785/01 TaxID=3021716 RepID=UPI00233108B0|nr:peptide deformylase [Spirulina sp. CS-785/01]MDB9315684.1 peptide deformylase [Spirulina sp. CS-785/01]
MSSAVIVDKKKVQTPPLELHYLGDRVLRKPTKRVSKVDDNTRHLVRDMLQTMYSSDGIGLAAPQVGVHKQLLVVDCDPSNAANPPFVLINPKITRSSKEVCSGEEGCLSIPGVYLDVVRPQAIEVSFKDENGRPQKMPASGLLARVIQHEMDHLNGVLFVDRVENELLLAEALTKHHFSMNAVKPVQ